MQRISVNSPYDYDGGSNQNVPPDDVGGPVNIEDILNRPRFMGQDDDVVIVGITGAFASQYKSSFYLRVKDPKGNEHQVLLNQELIKHIYEILERGMYAHLSPKPKDEGKFAQRVITPVDPNVE
jgi:DNA polymerase II small subunit/DNA polymerase delta subunit B